MRSRPQSLSRLPELDGDGPKRKNFASYPIGLFHLDLAEVRTAEGKLDLFVAAITRDQCIRQCRSR